MTKLDALAAAIGIEESYTTVFGDTHATSAKTKRAIVRALGYGERDEPPSGPPRAYIVKQGEMLPERLASLHIVDETGRSCDERTSLPLGYYTIHDDETRALLIVTPHTAYVAPQLDASPQWGLAVQLYALRSARNWGIGDFGDLRILAETTAHAGVAAIALNPLHQSHLTNPASASPYAPLSRTFLNVLYIDVADAGLRFGVVLDESAVALLREAELVDYPAVTRVKLAALERIHTAMLELPRSHPDRVAFDAFAMMTPGLEASARYEALMEWFTARDASIYGWMQWPQAYRSPTSSAVAQFAAQHRDRVDFYAFLQWLADEQLAAAARGAQSMPIGLYRDLAVGADLNSVDVWSDRDAYACDLSVGAPPDPLAPQGQDWGLPPFNPARLRERAYAPFIALVRANMRHAGALRIDHVMGLRRLFCIPRGEAAQHGAYVRYDFDVMVAILKLESVRNCCMLIGEDLGTVPDGFRERMERERIFGCRVFFFERRDDGSFTQPHSYTRDAVASIGTHDLPTLAGLWSEGDIALRLRLGIYTEEGAQRERWFRGELRARVIEALLASEAITPHTARALEAAGATASGDLLAIAMRSIYTFLGHTRSRLVLVQLEDIVLQREQMNVPGTIDEEPNWRRRVAVDVETLARDERFIALAAAMRLARNTGVGGKA